MPNWTENSLRLHHDNPEMITRAMTAMKEDRFFSEFAPCPKDLSETTSGFYGKDTREQKELELKQKANIDKHGFSDWYSWCNANWGTKWDACEVDATQLNPNTLTARFDTAWSPPVAFYETLKDMGFVVIAYYYEPGMAFCGSWDDGDDDYYKIDGNSEWVMDNIPSEIDFEFCISENMAEWEEQEREEA